MASISKLQVTIEFDYKGYAVIMKATGDLKEFQGETKSASEGIMDFGLSMAKGLATVGALGFAAKKTFDVLKGPAGLEFAATKFDRLACGGWPRNRRLVRQTVPIRRMVQGP